MASLQEALAANYDKLVETGVMEGGHEKVDAAPEKAEITKSEPIASAKTDAKVSDKTPAATSSGNAGTVAAQQGQTVHKPPSSWAAEYHEHFGKTDPRLQEYILKREKEASDGISKYGDQLKQYQAKYDAIEPLLAQRRDAWKANGWTEDYAIKQLLQLSDYASKDPKGFVKWFAQNQRLNLQDLDYELEQSEQNAIPPQVQQVIGGLQQRLEHFERAQQEQRNREFQALVHAFATEKDATGNPRRPHFEEVQKDIMGWFQTILGADPSLTFTQALDQAYDRAVWGNPNVRAKLLESQQAKEKDAREKEQRDRDQQGRFTKAADASKSAVKSESPGKSDPGTKKKDLRSSLSAKYDELAGGTVS